MYFPQFYKLLRESSTETYVSNVESLVNTDREQEEKENWRRKKGKWELLPSKMGQDPIFLLFWSFENGRRSHFPPIFVFRKTKESKMEKVCDRAPF